ncbi:type I secretion system protein, partial [Staphylococcus kloosii]
MSEFISALAGGLIALIGVWLQFRKEDRDKRIDYENDIKSMIDLIVYKVARIRNTELDEKRVLKSRDYTS